jgi:hypothetical protein
MNSHPRIMLLEPNRYRALLMQRTLEQHNRAAIVVRFSDPDQALSELSRNRYTAVIVNIDSLPGSKPGFLQSASRESPGAHLVAITSGGTSAEESDKLARCSQCHMVHINDAVELLASLPDLSGFSPEESDWQPVKPGSTRLWGLIVAGQ